MSEESSSLDTALVAVRQTISENSESTSQPPVTPTTSSTSEDLRRLEDGWTSSSASPVPPEVAITATGTIPKLPQLQPRVPETEETGGAGPPPPRVQASTQRPTARGDSSIDETDG